MAPNSAASATAAAQEQSLSHKETGNRHFQNQEFKLAIDSYRMILKKKKSRVSALNRAVCHSNVSASFFELANFSKAIEHAEKALDCFDQIKSSEKSIPVDQIDKIKSKNQVRIAKSYFYLRQFQQCAHASKQQQQHSTQDDAETSKTFQDLLEASNFYQNIEYPGDALQLPSSFLLRPNLFSSVYEYFVHGTEDANSLLEGCANVPNGDAKSRIRLKDLECYERQNLSLLCAGCNEGRHLFATMLELHQQVQELSSDQKAHVQIVMNDVLPTALARCFVLCVLLTKLGRRVQTQEQLQSDPHVVMLWTMIHYILVGVFIPRFVHEKLRQELTQVLELTTSSELVRQEYPLLQLGDDTLSRIHQVIHFWLQEDCSDGFSTFDKRYATYKAELCKLPKRYIDQMKKTKSLHIQLASGLTAAQKQSRMKKLNELSSEDYVRKYEYESTIKAPMVYHLAAERSKVLLPPMSLFETYAKDDPAVAEVLELVQSGGVPDRPLIEKMFRVNPTGIDQNCQRVDLIYTEFHIISTLCHAIPTSYHKHKKFDLFTGSCVYFWRVGQAMAACENVVDVVLKCGDVHAVVADSNQTYDRMALSSIPDYTHLLASLSVLMPALRRPSATLATFLEHKVLMNTSMWLNTSEYLNSIARLPSVKSLEEFFGIKLYGGQLWGKQQWAWPSAGKTCRTTAGAREFPKFQELRYWLHALFFAIAVPTQRKPQLLREEYPMTIVTFFQICDFIVESTECPPHWINRIVDEMLAQTRLKTFATYPTAGSNQSTESMTRRTRKLHHINMSIHHLEIRTHALIWQAKQSNLPLIHLPRLQPSGIHKYMFRGHICGRRAIDKGSSLVSALGLLLTNPSGCFSDDEDLMSGDPDDLLDTLGVSLSGRSSLRTEVVESTISDKYHLLSAVEWQIDIGQWTPDRKDWADEQVQELRFWMHQDDFKRLGSYQVKLLRTDSWIEVPTSSCMKTLRDAKRVDE